MKSFVERKNEMIEKWIKEQITAGLSRNNGNVLATARELVIPHSRLYKEMIKLKIDPNSFRKN